jgi:hypothetical protein
MVMSKVWLVGAFVAVSLVAACTSIKDGGMTVDVDEGEDPALDEEAGTVGGPPGPVGPDAW